MFHSMFSASKLLNDCESKNSATVIPKPSQSILIVTIPGFTLFPYKMFFMVDGATEDSIDSLCIDIFFSSNKNSILSFTAP